MNDGSDASNGHSNIVLRHFGEAGASSKSKDVTSMEWSPDGSMLATGSYDGLGRIWSKTGELLSTFDYHQGPIFSLKWNSNGTALLSGGVDKKVFVWNAMTGDVIQRFECHTGNVPLLYRVSLDVLLQRRSWMWIGRISQRLQPVRQTTAFLSVSLGRIIPSKRFEDMGTK